MKRFTGVLILVGFLASCAHTGPGPSQGERFGTCTSDAVKNTASGLIDNVATAVATQAYADSLRNLITKFGVYEIKCAVDLFIDTVTGRKAEADPLAAAQLARAQAWRNANP